MRWRAMLLGIIIWRSPLGFGSLIDAFWSLCAGPLQDLVHHSRKYLDT
jgi:hypothetical protein